jgi:hypothetical protein
MVSYIGVHDEMYREYVINQTDFMPQCAMHDVFGVQLAMGDILR